MAKTGDIVHVQVDDVHAYPAVITRIDENQQAYCTVFTPDGLQGYEGPLYPTHSAGHDKRDERPTFAFAEAPTAEKAEPKKNPAR